MINWFAVRLRWYAEQFPDWCKGGDHQLYTVSDACLNAFGMDFTQSPSVLAYQRGMQVRQGRYNAQSLFVASASPNDNEVRTVLDPVAPSKVGGFCCCAGFPRVPSIGEFTVHFGRCWLPVDSPRPASYSPDAWPPEVENSA